MPDLNHILLFIAWVSPAILLVRARRGGVDPAWRLPALVVLTISTLALVFARQQAGFIAGGAWFVLLFLPAVAIGRAIEQAQRGHPSRARRILRALRIIHPRRALQQHERVVDAIERAQAAGRQFFLPGAGPMLFGQPRVRMTPAVAVFLAVNGAMFAAETALGGSMSFSTLHRLGALEPYPVLVGGEYWRLLTAPFLHYGALHVSVNLFALYLFGPTLEHAIGSARFAASYLLAGVISCAQVAAFWRAGWLEADQLVGASGAVMGIVGTWAGVLLRQRHLPRTRPALRSIMTIVAIQCVFDILTPQVSMAAHLGGLATGFAMGLTWASPKSL